MSVVEKYEAWKNAVKSGLSLSDMISGNEEHVIDFEDYDIDSLLDM
jgi:hypothetical protein